MTAVERVVDAPDDPNDFYDWATVTGWGDGLPLIPPTPGRVEAMLADGNWDPDRPIATVPPTYSTATLEKIAANAVMAGCLPEHLPVVVAATEAMAAEEVNLYGVQGTTHACGMMVMVNGPIGRQLGMNGGASALGPGNRANATIGRAVRLVMQNIGGSVPGVTDKSTTGSPAKYSYCFAENELESPWEPFHVEHGYQPRESTVTVAAAESPHAIVEHSTPNLIRMFAETIASVGKNNAHLASDYFVGVAPQHAASMAGEGWTKRGIKQYLFETARIPPDVWVEISRRPIAIEGAEGGDIPGRAMSGRPEDIHVVVVGGPGGHSCWMPTIGIGHSATRRINLSDGSPKLV